MASKVDGNYSCVRPFPHRAFVELGERDSGLRKLNGIQGVLSTKHMATCGSEAFTEHGRMRQISPLVDLDSCRHDVTAGPGRMN